MSLVSVFALHYILEEMVEPGPLIRLEVVQKVCLRDACVLCFFCMKQQTLGCILQERELSRYRFL